VQKSPERDGKAEFLVMIKELLLLLLLLLAPPLPEAIIVPL